MDSDEAPGDDLAPGTPAPPVAPPKKPPTRGQTALLVIAIVVFIVLSYRFSGPGNQLSEDDYRYTAIDTCHDALKQTLKAPTTASFSGDNVTGTRSSGYTVTGNVDSENSFSAMLRSSWTCEATVSSSGMVHAKARLTR